MCTRGLRTRFSLSWMLALTDDGLPRLQPGAKARAGQPLDATIVPATVPPQSSLFRTNAEAGQDRAARAEVGHDLGQQLGPAHLAAPHRLLQGVRERGVRLGAPEIRGDLAKLPQRLLATADRTARG